MELVEQFVSVNPIQDDQCFSYILHPDGTGPVDPIMQDCLDRLREHMDAAGVNGGLGEGVDVDYEFGIEYQHPITKDPAPRWDDPLRAGEHYDHVFIASFRRANSGIENLTQDVIPADAVPATTISASTDNPMLTNVPAEKALPAMVPPDQSRGAFDDSRRDSVESHCSNDVALHVSTGMVGVEKVPSGEAPEMPLESVPQSAEDKSAT